MALLRTLNYYKLSGSQQGDVAFNGACGVSTTVTSSRVHITMANKTGGTEGKLRLTASEATTLARSLLLGVSQIEHDAAACLSMEVH